MTSQEVVSLRCVPVEQPIGVFYVGAIHAADLVAISWTDVRRIAPLENGSLVSEEAESPPPLDKAQSVIQGVDEDAVLIENQDFEEFLGIQRQLSQGRVSEIEQYVNNVDATFPTAVLLAISSQHAHFDESTSTLSIVRHSKVAKIIDGQHRIAGLREYSGNQFQINVAIFIDMDIQDQAMVFATINLKQTKVNKSLAYDLYEFTTTRSPQRTSHDIARFLNYKVGSPFEGRIKMLGVGRYRTETITQATFVDRLLRLISKNPMADRDLLRRGKRLTPAQGKETHRQIFRNLFIGDSDETIVVILWHFFLAVSKRWPYSWTTVERGNVLNRTTGFGALMRFMRVAYLSMCKADQVVESDKFETLLDRVQLEDGSFTPDVYLPGSSGEKALFDVLVKQSQLQSHA